MATHARWVDTSPLYLSELFVSTPALIRAAGIRRDHGRGRLLLVVIENDFGNAGTVDLIIDLKPPGTGADGQRFIRDTADVLGPRPR